MKRLVTVFAIGLMIGAAAAPASALSCAPPEPIDWSTRLPAADAAVIGVIESVEEVVSGEYASELILRVRVTERLQGRTTSVLEYATANHNPWGPYYEVGKELAIVVENGVVADGEMNICGPWFSPDELRRAAANHGEPVEPVPAPLDRVRLLLEHILLVLLFWVR